MLKLLHVLEESIRQGKEVDVKKGNKKKLKKICLLEKIDQREISISF